MVSGKRSYPAEADCQFCSKVFEFWGSQTPKYCSSSCKDRARYARNRESRLQAVRDYRKANPEVAKATAKRSYDKNREKLIAGSRRYYEANRERLIKNALEYQASNPLVTARTRNARRAAKSFLVTNRDLRRLIQRHEGRCAYCRVELGPFGRSQPNSLQWDHVVPLSKGGCNGVGNLLPVCRSCNLSKSDTLLSVWKTRRSRASVA